MHDEHPAGSRRVLVRAEADDAQQVERAGLRALLALVGALAVAAAAVPLAVLVRREHAPLVDLDLSVTRSAEQAVSESGLLLAAAQAVTLLGDPLLLTLLAALLTGVLASRGRYRRA